MLAEPAVVRSSPRSTIALGIGANTAIFSVVYGVLLKPLPLRDPDRLVQLWETNPLRSWTNRDRVAANLLDWRTRNRVFEDIGYYPGLEDKSPFTDDLSMVSPPRGNPSPSRCFPCRRTCLGNVA